MAYSSACVIMVMKAEKLFRAGQLGQAIETLTAELRDLPTDRKRRTFLFELLCFAGQFERAEKQLEALARGGEKTMVGALLYKSALHAEKTRSELFEKKDYPGTPSDEPPGVAATLNGKPVLSLLDSDPRIGDRLEVFAAGDYLWIPLEHVASIEIEPPRRLRDLLWIPAQLQTGPGFQDQDLGEVLLPVLSPLSWQHPDDAVRLGRLSEWCRDEDGDEVPFGQKMLLVDGEEYPFLQIRKLEISSAPVPA